MKYILKCISLFLLCLSSVWANVEETNLRNLLFSNYNPKVRPVENIDDSLTVQIGLALQNIESFDQMQESITLNAWIRQTWNDYRLSWNSTQSNLTFISVSKSQVWVPDTELLKCRCSSPDIYTKRRIKFILRWNRFLFKSSCNENAVHS